MTWDHIIVGGGSAGAVLANRLSADQRRRVLLIEAGPDTPPGDVPEIILDSYPGLAYFDPRYHWNRLRVFNESLAANRQRPRPRRFEQGRVMGGGSSINGQFAIRGLPRDFDEWAAMGLAGWGHADVQPYFRKLERDLDFAGELHGADGPIPIRRVFPEDWPGFSRAVLEALKAEGHGYFADHNAEVGDGSFPMALSNENDRRVSTAIAYLDAATRKRENLRILADSEVRGIVMDGARAVGVDVMRNGEVERFAGNEIIVSAGALHSPALLMRAGIGPAGQLKDLGIVLAAELPGVGENLQEHPQVIATAILAPGARLPPAVRRHIFLGARYSSGHQGCPPGDMFLTVTNKSGWHPLGRRLGSILAAVYKPYSQGCVRLASADPRDEPVVAFNLAGDGRDLARLVDGMRRVYRIFAAPAVRGSTLGLFPSTFDDHVREMMVPSLATWLKTGVVALAIDASPLTRRLAERFALSPGADIHALIADDEALEAWVRDKVCGGWHVTGTCRMGADGDPLAVLDGQCRVRGVEGLRVVDASVMPTSVSANTNITTIMIAEKIAAEILEG